MLHQVPGFLLVILTQLQLGFPDFFSILERKNQGTYLPFKLLQSCRVLKIDLLCIFLYIYKEDIMDRGKC